MLVLTRKLNQEILIGDNVKITVLKVKGNTVRLGIEAPREVRIVRGELPVESEPTLETTKEEVQANITVMFSDHVDHDSATATNPETALSSFEQSSPMLTVKYRDRIPPALGQNRLRQIADQLKDNQNEIT